jgi:spore maturation protein CgeB
VKIVIFGLTVTSSWGNGHATLWRALIRALIRRKHDVGFFEKDVPYYAAHRDHGALDGLRLFLYDEWDSVSQRAREEVDDADVAIVTSFCPHALAATELVVSSRAALRVFYDLDTPVTLEGRKSGIGVSYLGTRGLRDFDLVLSFTGGRALSEARDMLGAKRVEPLYGCVDPDVHRPVPARDEYAGLLSYLGTYSADRQESVETLFLGPARRMPGARFVLGGAQYPDDATLPANVRHFDHVAPPDHGAFFASSAMTLNITRGAMAKYGHCPSGRLFEAAACGVPILSDYFEGIDHFLEPGKELLLARSTEDVLESLRVSHGELVHMAARARERVLNEHSADVRVRDFERVVGAKAPWESLAS